MSLISGSNKSYLGVDIGSTSVKIVELKKEGQQVKLVTYGFSENLKIVRNEWMNKIAEVANIIKKIHSEANMNSKLGLSALPNFSVFSSILNLTNVSKKDMASAVNWEAKKVIPLPLEEMILDWRKIEEDEVRDKNNIKILLTGAPKALVKKYMEIFREAQISLLSLETETFSLIRSLLGNDKSSVMIVEIGANTTDVTIVDKSIPVLNRSIDIGGLTITKLLAVNLNVNLEKAEQFKYDMGVSAIDSVDNNVPKIINEAIAPIINEIKYSKNLFQTKNNRQIEKVILSGGSSLLPNLVNYLSGLLDTKVVIGDPWARIVYPPDMRPLLNEIGPSMSVAVGLAMREIE
jgi:type IV pilus assembly protein PilM